MPSVPKIVVESLAFYKVADMAYGKQRTREKDDLAFQTPEGQWDPSVRSMREASNVGGIPVPARPMLSVATLDEPIQLVLNQEKAAHLGVNIHPLTEDASDDTAEVLQDLYRQIETDSRAGLARSWGFDRAAKAGWGCYEVRSVYDPDTGVPGDQKLVIKRFLYQSAVYLDPFAQEPDWSDGERALVIEDVPWTVYKRKYHKSDVAKYTDQGLTEIGDVNADWVGGDGPESRTVRVANYYYVEHDTKTITLPKAGKDGKDFDFEQDIRQVKVCKHNAVEVLDEYEWGGQYIPLIPVIGRELQPFDGERRWVGMIHNAKDGARLTNYAASGAVEIAALEPKAPFQLDPEQIEGYEEFWKQANTRSFPYLPSHRTINGQVVAPPVRTQIDVGRLGPNMSLLSMGRDFVQAATATFDPALGKQPTAHRSGRAIVALQDQTVEGTSHYVSNLADISMTYEAMVILDAIPYYYDRPGRVLTLRDAQDKQRRVIVNAPHVMDPQTGKPMPAQKDDPNAKVYDLKKGRYGVSVTISKSYKSKLEAGQNQIGEILQAAPELFPLIGPEYVKFLDVPNGKEIAKLLLKNRSHLMPWLDDAPENQGPQQLAQAQQQLQVMGEQLKQATEYIQKEQAKHQATIDKAKIDATTSVAIQKMKDATAIAVAQINAEAKGLQVATEARNEQIALAMEADQAAQDRQHEAGLAEQQHAQTLQQADQEHQQALEQGDQSAAQQAALAEQGQGHALEQGQQAADLAPPPVEGSAA